MLPIASIALAGAFHGMHAQAALCVHKGPPRLHHSIAYAERMLLILHMRACKQSVHLAYLAQSSEEITEKC